MPFVNIGGASMHYRHRRAAREAPTLVFINSLGTDFRIWDEMADRLAGDATLLNYDKRGHGLSGGGVASMDDHVDDLAGLLDHLGIDDAILCGLSIGGLIAQGFLMRRPKALRALILCDTAAKIGTAESWNARIETVERDGIEAIADSVHGEMVHAGIPPGPAGRPCRIPYHAGPAAARRLCRQLRGFARRRLHGGRAPDIGADLVRGRRPGRLHAAGSRAADGGADPRRPLRDHRRRRSHTLRRAAGRTCLACPRLYRLLACERIMNEPTGGDSRSVAGELIGGIEAVGN